MKIDKKCQACDAPFTIDFEDDEDEQTCRFTSSIVKYCKSCTKILADRAAENTRLEFLNQRKLAWRTLCPPLFAETDEALLPMPEKHKEGMAWEYGKSGLLLFGKTRTGKSRCAWKICEKYFLQAKSVMVMDSRAGFEYGSIFTVSGERVLDWVNERSRCGILFLDDVFKVKLTDSFEAALFAIVDYRLNHKLPIIATLNDTGATLSARMTEDRGSAFVARLKESATTISFA